jgi:hypothetical protein
MVFHNAEWHILCYTECHSVMSAIMLNIMMLSVIILSVVMLIVVAL